MVQKTWNLIKHILSKIFYVAEKPESTAFAVCFCCYEHFNQEIVWRTKEENSN